MYTLYALGIVQRPEEALEECQSFVRLLRGMGMKVFYAKTVSNTPSFRAKGLGR